MNITASMVKELRSRTGAGMMECKKALQEANGDIEAAIVGMRKRGQLKAAKRAGKIAAEGIIEMCVSVDNKQAIMLELNSETDFVARDTHFREFAAKLAQTGLDNKTKNVESLLALTATGSDNTLEQERQALVAKIGENVQLRRIALVESDALVGSYKHGDRIGVLIALNKAESGLARDLAMHIAATNPQAIDESALSADVIAKERDIFVAQAKESGKPDNIIEKMVTGRIAKFVKEVCLIEQPFVKEPDQTVKNLLKAQDASVLEFMRFEVGEGIEKETVDFAEEVRAQAQGSE